MTDQTKCPHCGSVCTSTCGSQKFYLCGSYKWEDHVCQSRICEVSQLQQKVAAQQALLDDIRNNLCVQTFDTCPPGYAGIMNEGMLRRLGVKLCDA